MLKYNGPKQGTKEWLEQRSKYIGASELGNLVDFTNKRITTIHKRLVNNNISKLYTNYGKYTEDFVRRIVAKEFPEHEFHEYGSMHSDKYPSFACSPDNVIYNPKTDERWLAEYKSPYVRDVDSSTYIPRDYIYQLYLNHLILTDLGILKHDSPIVYCEVKFKVSETQTEFELEFSPGFEKFEEFVEFGELGEGVKFYLTPISVKLIKIKSLSELISTHFPPAGDYFGTYCGLPDHKPPRELNFEKDSFMDNLAQIYLETKRLKYDCCLFINLLYEKMTL